jgi:L-ascorbate metabolism protein UlaG (beta-lactamase superfamily)
MSARFRNLDPWAARGPLDILKWRIVDTIAGKRRADRGETSETPRVDNDGKALHTLDPSLTWIGHATFVYRLGGLCVATDPIWIDSLGPGVRRNVAPGVAIDALPPIDVITISHAHYDHLDVRSLRMLADHTRAITGKNPLFLVPSEVGRYLKPKGLEPIVERGWWESHRVQHARGGATFTLVPQQHWSMRTPFDRDAALWGGWVCASNEGTAYHAGDTGWFEHFREIGERVGPIDWAMVPIGAYDPQWFMKPQHINPEEAGRAFVQLGAKNLVAMHWGTFKLTDEPLGEPPKRLIAWWNEKGPGERARDRLWIPKIGETRALRR